MFQDKATSESRYKKFIETVVDSELVWGLSSDDGWATSDSNEFEDTELILFWSDKAYCAASAKDEWSHYEAETIPLAEFLENWCVGMHNDNSLTGINFDMNLFGKEVEPLQLAFEILDLLIRKNKMVDLKSYDSLQDLKNEIEQVLSNQE